MSNKKKIAAGIALSACLLFAMAALRLPERGRKFPAIHEIASIQAVGVRDDEEGEYRSFEIPRHYRGEVLAALSNSEQNDGPAKLSTMGRLEIRIADGQLTDVQLYGWTEFEEFSVGRMNYRGFNLDRLDGILRRAISETKQPL